MIYCLLLSLSKNGTMIFFSVGSRKTKGPRVINLKATVPRVGSMALPPINPFKNYVMMISKIFHIKLYIRNI